MKIYLDVLMITNAVITLIYINCICRVMHEKISSARETAAAAVGGAGSLIAVLDSSSFLGALGITAAKLALMLMIIFIAFRPRGMAGYIKRFFVFLLCELIFGGACFAFVNFSHRKVLLIKNYTVYFDISLPALALCSCAVYAVISFYERIQRRRADSRTNYRATYSLGRFAITLPAIADSGNRLCDSFTGEPVVIFRSDELYSHYDLDRPEQLAFYGFHPTPYSALQEDGIVYVTSKGTVEISGGGCAKQVSCSVGIIPSGKKTQCAVFDPKLLI